MKQTEKLAMPTKRIEVADCNTSVALRDFIDNVKQNCLGYWHRDFTDLNVRSDCDDSLLHVAARFGDDPLIIEELILHGVEVDAIGDMSQTPLRVACSSGNLDAVKVFLRYGANIDAEDEFHMTPIDAARNHNHKEIEKYLEQWRNGPHPPSLD